jgi:hypothetical protein
MLDLRPRPDSSLSSVGRAGYSVKESCKEMVPVKVNFLTGVCKRIELLSLENK